MLLRKGGSDMQNQAYNILIDGDSIIITKNGQQIYKILLSTKSINLKELYDNMQVDINDNYVYENEIKKIDEPKKDIERVFNNTFDFFNSLLVELNKKLTELRDKQESSVFK